MDAPSRIASWLHRTQGAPSFTRSLRKARDSKALPFQIGSAMFWFRSAQALALAVAVCFSMGASDSSARFHDLNHRLMCTCGCAQIARRMQPCWLYGVRTGTCRTESRHRHRHERQGNLFPIHRQVRRNRAGRAHHAWLRPGCLDRTLRRIRRGAARHHSAYPALGWHCGRQEALASAQGPAIPAPDDPADRERRDRIRRETGSATEVFEP